MINIKRVPSLAVSFWVVFFVPWLILIVLDFPWLIFEVAEYVHEFEYAAIILFCIKLPWYLLCLYLLKVNIDRADAKAMAYTAFLAAIFAIFLNVFWYAVIVEGLSAI